MADRPSGIRPALDATVIGDDRLRQQSQGRITPDSFTHGSSARRVRWFKRGFERGDLGECETLGRG
jgi:uncharacterized protein